MEEILNTTVSEVRQSLRVDRVIIYQIQPNGDGLITAESVEFGLAPILGFRLQDDWFKQNQLKYQKGENLVIDDLLKADPASPCMNLMEQWNVKAAMIVPILQAERLWGSLCIYHSGSRRWEPVEVALLEQLATQVAIAIQQSELYQQVQQLNLDLERQVQERTSQLRQTLQFEAMLKRITDSIRDSLDEDQILQTAVEQLALGLDLKGCNAALHNLKQETATIRYKFIRSELFESARGAVVRLSGFTEILDALLQRQSIQYCQIAANSDCPDRAFSSVLACPLLSEQGILGNLWLFKSCQEIFSDEEIRLVQQVANQCVIAIRQARLYQAAQTQVAALEALNQLKDDFLSTVSHELRTPMSNMKMAIHMLQKGATPERHKQYLSILQAECSREIELINDLLDLQRLEAASYRVSLEAINLKQCLLKLVESFQSRVVDREQTLRVNLPSNLASIATDQATLERILAELLNNACKYTPPGGAIVLTVQQALSSIDLPSQITFSVSNRTEIPAQELSRIFEKFYRIPNADPWRQGGTGLGLALVQRLVMQLGGSIQAESQAGWTTFTVQIPLAETCLVS